MLRAQRKVQEESKEEGVEEEKEGPRRAHGDQHGLAFVVCSPFGRL